MCAYELEAGILSFVGSMERPFVGKIHAAEPCIDLPKALSHRGWQPPPPGHLIYLANADPDAAKRLPIPPGTGAPKFVDPKTRSDVGTRQLNLRRLVLVYRSSSVGAARNRGWLRGDCQEGQMVLSSHDNRPTHVLQTMLSVEGATQDCHRWLTDPSTPSQWCMAYSRTVPEASSSESRLPPGRGLAPGNRFSRTDGQRPKRQHTHKDC